MRNVLMRPLEEQIYKTHVSVSQLKDLRGLFRTLNNRQRLKDALNFTCQLKPK